MPSPITASHLLAAAEGHVERTAVDEGADIPRCLVELGIESGDLEAICQHLAAARPPRDSRAWSAGVLDGIVLGVRAARIAEGIADS